MIPDGVRQVNPVCIPVRFRPDYLRKNSMNRSEGDSVTEQDKSADWNRKLAEYRKPDVKRSLFELILTAVCLAVLWTMGWTAMKFGLWWLALILTVPAGAFLVRLFMIQHDCGHGAFFRRRLANDWVGRVIGVLTLTPYDCWRRAHAIHHATSGNLDRRGVGDIDTLTVDEYRSRSRARW